MISLEGPLHKHDGPEPRPSNAEAVLGVRVATSHRPVVTFAAE